MSLALSIDQQLDTEPSPVVTRGSQLRGSVACVTVACQCTWCNTACPARTRSQRGKTAEAAQTIATTVEAQCRDGETGVFGSNRTFA